MMTRVWAVLGVLVFATAASAQDSYEKVLDEMLPAFNQLGETLEKIKDKKSADEAKPAVKNLADQLVKLKARADALGEPKGEKKEELEKKYKGKLETAAKKMSTEIVRIASQVEDGKAIVKDISEALGPLSKKK